MTNNLVPPAQYIIDSLLKAALTEDLGTAGDITTMSVIPAGVSSRGAIVARADGVVAGLQMAVGVFGLLDQEISTTVAAADGDSVTAGTMLCVVHGPAHPILAGERTCLNLLGHLSGIATATREVVDLIAHTGATVVDTRKTTPGLRALEKYAVVAGGASNHRFGLFDAVLIKDNHLAAHAGVGAAVQAARASIGHSVKVEVEIDDLSQLEEAIQAGAEAVLLDNMEPNRLREAVALADGRCLLEASGGITPRNVVDVAETGVDLISLGWLTHSAPQWDVSLDFETL